MPVCIQADRFCSGCSIVAIHLSKIPDKNPTVSILLPRSRSEGRRGYCTTSVSLVEWTKLAEPELNVPVTVKL